MKPTVYIETTVVSYLKAWPSRDLIRVAHQQITKEWWDTQRGQFECFTSELTLTEAAEGDPKASADRMEILQTLPLLAIPRAAEDLAEGLVSAAALPPVAARDALHVAIAATNGIDILLTWNCRHLANVVLRPKIEEVCADAGFRAPMICTPEELLGGEP